MKEFEKWWGNPENKELSELYYGPPDAKRFAKQAWKFALKWVLKEIGLRSPNGRLGQRSFLDELVDIIGKELK